MSSAPSRMRALALAALLPVALAGGAILAGAEGAAFGFFAALAVGGGALCLLEPSSSRGVCGLLATFFGVAGLFLLLESDFLAMTQLLIGAGATAALLLFGARVLPDERGGLGLARVLAALALVVPLCAFAAWRCAGAPPFRGTVPADASSLRSDAGRIGVALVDPRQYVAAFELAAVLFVVALVAALCFARREEQDPA